MRRLALPPSVKLIASFCAQFGNPDGTEVRPGEKRLIVESGYSERTVRRALAALRDIGLMKRVRVGSTMGRRALADEYRLVLLDDPAEAVYEWNARVNRVAKGLVDDGSGRDLSRSKKSRQKSVGSPAKLTGDLGSEMAPRKSTADKEHRPLQQGDPKEHRPIATWNTGHHSTPTRTVTTPVKPPHQIHGSSKHRPLTSRASQSTDDIEIDGGKSNRQPCPHGNSSRTRRDGKPRCEQCRNASVTHPPASVSPTKCPEHGLNGGRRPDGKPHCTLCRVQEARAA